MQTLQANPTVNEAIALKDATIAELRSIVTLQQQTIENQREQLAAKCAELGDEKVEMRHLRDRLEKRTEALDALSGKHEATVERLDEVKKQNIMLKEECLRLHNELRTRSQALDVATDTIKGLHTALDQEREALARARMELETARNTLVELGIELNPSFSLPSVESSDQFGALTAGDIDDAIYAPGLQRQQLAEAPQEDAPEGEPIINPAAAHLVRQALAAA